MTICIEATDALDAWRSGCAVLSKERDVFNIVTTIHNPCLFNSSWVQDFNPRSFNSKAASLKDVICTIFPYPLYDSAQARKVFYEKYISRHIRASRIHPRTKRSWGTYFLRLLSFGDKQINQLESVIGALNARGNNYKASLVMHLSSAETDSLIKTLGNPCLQFLEVLCPTPKTISLLAVYRNHDYFHKAFGNFIALGMLLEFICAHTGRTPDSVICHSAHAYYERSKHDLLSIAQLT